jgi:hypothetical protein
LPAFGRDEERRRNFAQRILGELEVRMLIRAARPGRDRPAQLQTVSPLGTGAVVQFRSGGGYRARYMAQLSTFDPECVLAELRELADRRAPVLLYFERSHPSASSL